MATVVTLIAIYVVTVLVFTTVVWWVPLRPAHDVDRWPGVLLMANGAVVLAGVVALLATFTQAGVLMLTAGLVGLIFAFGLSPTWDQPSVSRRTRAATVPLVLLIALGLAYAVLSTMVHFSGDDDRVFTLARVSLPEECSYTAELVTCPGARWVVNGEPVFGTLVGTGDELFAGFTYDPFDPDSELPGDRTHVSTVEAYVSGDRAYTRARAPETALDPEAAARIDYHAGATSLAALRRHLPKFGWAAFLGAAAALVGYVALLNAKAPTVQLVHPKDHAEAERARRDRRALAQRVQADLVGHARSERDRGLASTVALDVPVWSVNEVRRALTEATALRSLESILAADGPGGTALRFDGDTFSVVFRTAPDTTPMLVLLDELPGRAIRVDTDTTSETRTLVKKLTSIGLTVSLDTGTGRRPVG